MKRVRFDETPQIRVLFVWEFAHWQARKGPWMQCARDRARFMKRIADVEYKIEDFLERPYRERIYNERFNN